jgi:hypothetical protein
MIPDSITIALRPWAEQDFPLMERTLGDPAMTVHLGGPETPEKLKARHERYTRFSETGPGCMYVVVIGSEAGRGFGRGRRGSLRHGHAGGDHAGQRDSAQQTTGAKGVHCLPRGIAAGAAAVAVGGL